MYCIEVFDVEIEAMMEMKSSKEIEKVKTIRDFKLGKQYKKELQKKKEEEEIKKAIENFKPIKIEGLFSEDEIKEIDEEMKNPLNRKFELGNKKCYTLNSEIIMEKGGGENK